MECIVLAGGLGTRLRGVIGAYPKCMAEVNGKPFLFYVLEYLKKQKCNRVLLSLGYLNAVVIEWLQGQEYPFPIDYVIENEPLGTGGGIKLAVEHSETNNIAVLNGDTFFDVDLSAMFYFHLSQKSATTLGLKEMFHTDRYGIVNTDEKGLITAFEEKQYKETATINGGIYIVNKKYFLSKNMPEKCSFEKEYLEKYVGENEFYGYRTNAYFIDIGIPEDYEKAQKEL